MYISTVAKKISDIRLSASLRCTLMISTSWKRYINAILLCYYAYTKSDSIITKSIQSILSGFLGTPQIPQISVVRGFPNLAFRDKPIGGDEVGYVSYPDWKRVRV